MTLLLLAVIYLAFIGLGLPDSMLGAVWPVLHLELGVPVAVAGFASIVSTIGSVGASLFSDRAIHKFGTGIVTVVSIALTAVSLMCISRITSYAALLLLCVPLGMGGGTVDTALNNYVALHYRSWHMNWLHSFWGIGATLGPFVVSLFLRTENWRGAYNAISLALFFIVLVMLISLPLWKQNIKQQYAGDSAQTSRVVPKKELLSQPGAIAACLAFVFYCSVEYATGLWAASYYVNVKHIAVDAAAAWGSSYYLGITFGRMLSGFAAIKFSDRILVRAGLALIAAGLMALKLPLEGTIQITGILLIGLGCAPIFPSLLNLTPQRFGVEYSQGMMGLQMAFAYLGATLMSPLFGWLSPIIGIASWPYYLMLLSAGLWLSFEVTERKTRTAQSL